MSETLGALLSRFAATLGAAAVDEPRRQARRLIAEALDLAPSELLAHPERPVAPRQLEHLDALLARMAAGEPVSRILGRREFWGLDFVLSPDTLDPRPDTETLVEAVLKRLPQRATALRFLDLGTGTGCVLLALLHEYPTAFGIGVDVAAGAAATARRNAAALGMAERAAFLVGDWASALCGRFDAITANPPYIRTAALADLPRAVIGHDPVRALDGGRDGLDSYRGFASDIAHLLRPGGIIACEVGAGQAAAVAAIAAAAGLVPAGTEQDLAGIARVVVAGAASGKK